jgi:hypothetical protein
LTQGITRREALHRIGAAALVAGAPALAACALSDDEVESRLAAALAQLSGSSPAPSAIAASAPLSRPEAARRLRGDTGARWLWAATSSGVALRAFLASRRQEDMSAGHVRWVNGWLLAESEIAAANLAAG